MRLTGSEIVTEILVREGVPYAIGIGGHGNLALVDAFRRYQDRIRVIMPRNEQAAVHMADGYFAGRRASRTAACAVHGAASGWPMTTRPRLVGLTPSTSFFGAIAAWTVRALI